MTNVSDFEEVARRVRGAKRGEDPPPFDDPQDPGPSWKDAHVDDHKPPPDPSTTQFRELTDDERAAVVPYAFKPWGKRDLAAIPVPEFIYSDFYARGYTSVTAAPPKVGKSMLALAEAIDMASGRGFLTGRKRAPMRVLYYNAEDDIDLLNARVAALLTLYGIDQSEIAETLYLHSGVEESVFYLVSGQDPVINETLFVSLEKFAELVRLDAMIFDPLQDLTRSPETNDVFRILGQRLRRMASSCHIALGLIHHTRKQAPGHASSIDDMRGGSSLRGTARFNRILVPMTDEEATRAGVDNHRSYFRIGDVESNLAPPSSDVNRWFEKLSVKTPNGHNFPAVRPWEWPDAFDGVTTEDARKVQLAVLAQASDPPAESVQADRWVGHLVAETLGLDVDLSKKGGDRQRITTMVKAWIRTGVLAIEKRHNGRKGREINVIVAGSNNPTTRENFD